jgi:D-ribose pyranase
MKEDGIWHPRLVHVLTALGHGDLLMIADAGLPVPPGVEAIDLLWRRGEPRVVPVLEAIAAEGVFEAATVAGEADHVVAEMLASAVAPLPVETVPHEELKRRNRAARAVVRTGEDTPYSCVLLRAGVAF